MRAALLLAVCGADSHMRVDTAQKAATVAAKAADAAAAAPAAAPVAPAAAPVAPTGHKQAADGGSIPLFVASSLAELTQQAVRTKDAHLASAVQRRLQIQARLSAERMRRERLRAKIKAKLKLDLSRDAANEEAEATMKDCFVQGNCFEQNQQMTVQARAQLTAYTNTANQQYAYLSGKFKTAMDSQNGVIMGTTNTAYAGSTKNKQEQERMENRFKGELVGIADPMALAEKASVEHSKATMKAIEETFDPEFADKSATESELFHIGKNVEIKAAQEAAYANSMAATQFYDEGAGIMVKTAGAAERNQIKRESSYSVEASKVEAQHEKYLGELETDLESIEGREEATDVFVEKAGEVSDELTEGSDPDAPSYTFQEEASEEHLADSEEEGSEAVESMIENMEYINENFNDLADDVSGNHFDKMADMLGAAADTVKSAVKDTRIEFKKIGLEFDTSTAAQLGTVSDGQAILKLVDSAIARQFSNIAAWNKQVTTALLQWHERDMQKAESIRGELTVDRDRQKEKLLNDLQVRSKQADSDIEEKISLLETDYLQQIFKYSTDAKNGLDENRATVKTNFDESDTLQRELNEANAMYQATLPVFTELKNVFFAAEKKIEQMLEAVNLGSQDVQSMYMNHLHFLADSPERKQVQDTLVAAQQFIAQFQQNQQEELARLQDGLSKQIQGFDETTGAKTRLMSAQIIRAKQAIDDRKVALKNAIDILAEMKIVSADMKINSVDDLKNLAYRFSLLPRQLEGNVTELMTDARTVNTKEIEQTHEKTKIAAAASNQRMTKELNWISNELGAASTTEQANHQLAGKGFAELQTIINDRKLDQAKMEEDLQKLYKDLREGPVASLDGIYKVLDQIDATAKKEFTAKREEWTKHINEQVAAFEKERAALKEEYLQEVNRYIMEVGSAGGIAAGEVKKAKTTDSQTYAQLVAQAREKVAQEAASVRSLDSKEHNMAGIEAVNEARAAVEQGKNAETSAESNMDKVLNALHGFETSLEAKFAAGEGNDEAALKHLQATVAHAIQSGEMKEEHGRALLEEAMRNSNMSFEEREAAQKQQLAMATKDMASEERAIHEKGAEASEKITEEEKKMKQHFLLEMQKLTMEEGSEAAEAEREQEGLKAVAASMEREKALAMGYAKNGEEKVLRNLHELDSGEQMAGMQGVLTGIEALQKDERDEAEKAKAAAEQKAFAYQQMVDDTIGAAMKQIGALKQPLANTEKAVENQFEQLSSLFEDERSKVGDQLSDAFLTATQVYDAFEARGVALREDIDAYAKQHENAANLAKFGGRDAYEYVAKTMNTTLEQGQTLEAEISGGVQPMVEDFRERVGQVFQSFGLELDMKSVDEATQADIDAQKEELSNHGKMLQAQADAEAAIRAIEAQAKKELKAAQAKMNAEIAQVMSMMHLSESERTAMIATIKAKADQSRDRILASAQNKIKEQAHLGTAMDTKEQTLEMLIQKAQRLAAGQFQVTPAGVIKSRMEKAADKIQKTRDRFITPAFGVSFLETAETDETAAHQREQAQQHRVAMAASAWRTIAQKVKSVQVQSDRDDAKWEQVLNSLRAV